MPIFVGFFGWINERREWRGIRPHDKYTNLIYVIINHKYSTLITLITFLMIKK